MPAVQHTCCWVLVQEQDWVRTSISAGAAVATAARVKKVRVLNCILMVGLGWGKRSWSFKKEGILKKGVYAEETEDG